MNKKLKAILRTVILLITALVLGLSVYSCNASRVGGNAVPMPFGVGAAVVLSGSMEPELSVGDLLIVSEREAYEVGDIVVFQDGRTPVTHRIVETDEDGKFITRGDANNTNDAPIFPDQIKGEVVFSIPLLGYAVNVIKNPFGTLFILALAVFLLERSFHAEKQKDAKKLDAIKEEIEKLKQEQQNNN